MDSYTYKFFTNSFLCPHVQLKKTNKLKTTPSWHFFHYLTEIKDTYLGLQNQLCAVHIFETVAVIIFKAFCFDCVTPLSTSPLPPLLFFFFFFYWTYVRCYRENTCMILARLFLFIIFDLVLKCQLAFPIVMPSSINSMLKSNKHLGFSPLVIYFWEGFILKTCL